jgi:uncharacterized protein
MKIDDHRRSENFEDRGRGGGGGGGSGLPVRALSSLVQLLGVKGTVIVGAVLGVGYFILPSSLRNMLLTAVTGQESGSSTSTGTGTGSGSVCQASPGNNAACDFSRVILASTEDVWAAQFQAGRLPEYGSKAAMYRNPTLVVFSGTVSTGGCGGATSDTGPFYCPADQKLYIDPSFYQVMESRLKAPGDFAQAYVIAHEVGHHVQNVIGSTEVRVKSDSKNQGSVRVELQADCLAGVWGHTAQSSLQITDEDLREAVNAAHAIGDDTLGHANERDYTHGTSEQRMRWFRVGFDSGDARKCDTLAVASYRDL